MESYFKLGIGFPITDPTVWTPFFLSMLAMFKPDYVLLFPKIPCETVADARNNLAEGAILNGCSHLLMMDTDQTYPQDMITKLIEKRQLDVVGVRVHRRYPPFLPICYRGEPGKYKYVPDDEMFGGDLIEVDATGTGAILLKVDILKTFGPPWFEVKKHEGKTVGEDISFCQKVKENGFKIYVDTSIEVGHLSAIEINRSFYEVFKAVYNAKQTQEVTK